MGKPTSRLICIYCNYSNLCIKATYQRILIHTHQGNRLILLPLRVPKWHCHDCQRYFHNTKIIADRFHVVRLVNYQFLKIWQQQDPVGRMNRGLLCLMRRHQWRLALDQYANLMNYLNHYPLLKSLHQAKQRLMKPLLIKGIRAKHAKVMIPRLLTLT